MTGSNHFLVASLLFGLCFIACSSTKSGLCISKNNLAKVEDVDYAMYYRTDGLDRLDCLDTTQVPGVFLEPVEAKEFHEMGRRVITSNVHGVLSAIKSLESQKGTELQFLVFVDRSDKIRAAKYLKESTARFSEKDLPDVLEAVFEYEFQAKPEAPCVEAGLFKVVLENISTIGNQTY